MIDQDIRLHTAEEMKRLLSRPDALQHLGRHHWHAGMPVVIAAVYETLSHVMGLVSTYESEVLIASYDPSLDSLSLWHVSGPDRETRAPVAHKEVITLRENEAVTLREICQAATLACSLEFRPKHWDYTVSIREVPCFVRNDRTAQGAAKVPQPIR